MQHEALFRAIHEFTRSILDPYDVVELLQRITDHATAVVDGAGAGIMLESRDGTLEFAAASSDRVTAAERHQDRVGSGACHDAFVTNTTVVVDDLAATEHWPSYTPKVLSLGLAAVIGVPLNAQGQTIGVLNVYREAATSWSPDDVQACEVLASMGASYILHASQLTASQKLAEQLQAALDSRAVIERAKGMMMATLGVDSDTAFATLRKVSMDDNRKLRDVAQEVVDRHAPG